MGEIFFCWLTRGHRPRAPGCCPAWPMTQDPLESANFGHAQPLAEAIPGHSINQDTNQVTSAPVVVPSQGDTDTPDPCQESSSTSPSKKCACIVCLGVGIIDPNRQGLHRCHLASCSWIANDASAPYRHLLAERDRAAHEKTHYRPENSQSPLSCPTQNCRFTSKRWSDLHRHTSAKHCNNPTKFACSVMGCKYYGEGNGFIRKDKLTAHYKSMHQGQKVHGQAVRAIKPAPASFHAEASGSSSFGAYGK